MSPQTTPVAGGSSVSMERAQGSLKGKKVKG